MIRVLVARLRSDSFFAHFSGTVMFGVLGGGLTILTHMLLATYLGAAGYGAYAVALSILNILVLFVRMGLDVATVRYVAVYSELKEWNLLAGYLRAARLFIACTAALALGLSSIGLLLFGSRLDPALRWGLLTILPALPLLALGQINDAALRGLGQVLTGQISQVIGQPLLLLLLLVLCWISGIDPVLRLLLAGICLIASFAGALLLSSVLLLRHRRPGIRAALPRAHIREWLFSTPAMMIVSSFSQYQNQLIVIFLGFFLNVEAAGIFALAMRIANVIQIVLYGANLPAMPRLSRAFARDDREEMNWIAGLAATACFFVVLPITGGFLLLGSFLLVFLGPTYAAAYGPLAILCLGLQLQSAFSPAAVVMGVSGNQSAVGLTFILTICLCLGSLFVLRHSLTLTNVAACAAMMGAGAFAVLSALAYARLGIRCWVQPSLFLRRGRL
ncbi:MAG: oligosaccharide flippase family protein [Alphaproteobacteria bacterium]